MLPHLQLVFLTFLFLSSASVAKKPPGPTTKTGGWSTVLALLNSEPRTKTTLPFSNAIEEDLMALNKKEMAEIAQNWGKEKKKLTQKTDQEVRLAENIFFQKAVEELNAPLFKALSSQEKTFTRSYQEAAKKALQKIEESALTSPAGVHTIKDGGQIGFCFSRALLIHYWLLKEGVPQEDIAKVFSMGVLSVEKILWKFHVAVWVKDAKEGFLVVDPLQKKLLPYKEWLKINADYDLKRPYSRVRFYMTSPKKFLPSFGAYQINLLHDPHLKFYFDEIVSLLK